MSYRETFWLTVSAVTLALLTCLLVVGLFGFLVVRSNETRIIFDGSRDRCIAAGGWPLMKGHFIWDGVTCLRILEVP